MGGQARLPARRGQGLFILGAFVLGWEAEWNELTLCSDGDISMGQGSSITMWWWLRRAVNPSEMPGCFLRCSQGSLPGEAQDLQQPRGSDAWGGLGERPALRETHPPP